MESTVQVKIQALDNSKAAFASLNKNLQTVNKSTSTTRERLDNLKPAFEKMAAIGTVAFAGIVAGARQSVNAYAEVERAQRQLNNAVINISKGTKEQVDQINQLTSALERKAGVDADSLTMGVAQLSTFGLTSKSVIDLTKSLADLTVNQSGLNATSQDYIGSANTIAKALNGQFGILEKSGIRFTEAQKKIIEFGTETEKVAAVQQGLAQNLRETTDTVNGADLAMAKMQRTMENINENVGRALAPVFLELAETLQPMIEKLAAWSEQNPELTKNIVLASAAVTGLIAVLGFLSLAILAFNPYAVMIVGAITGIGFIVKSVKDGMQQFGITWSEVWTTIKDATISAVDQMLGPLDEIVSAVAKALEALAKLPGVKTGLSITKKAFSSVTDLFRAEGGPVNAGQGYIVGEKGPEWFMPKQSGTIIPNNSLSAVGAGAAGGPNINLYISGTFLDDRSAAKRLGSEIMTMLKQNTKL